MGLLKIGKVLKKRMIVSNFKKGEGAFHSNTSDYQCIFEEIAKALNNNLFLLSLLRLISTFIH